MERITFTPSVVAIAGTQARPDPRLNEGEMKFEIKHRYSGNVLLSMDTESIKLCVEAAAKSGAYLREADLGGAYLRGADLRGAYLREANLRGADLGEAYLRGADLGGADLRKANLGGANLAEAYLRKANLGGANLGGANLAEAYLRKANLGGANLGGADLGEAYLRKANLGGANLGGANLAEAYLRGAYLRGADLEEAYLRGADLVEAYLRGADLEEAKNQIKIMGVEPGNIYWKRFDIGLNNHGYQFHVGLNALRDGEIFNGDERVLCGYPGFHFASRSWCAAYYPQRPLEARIRIPLDAKICEPWATDGKASADRIEILQVFDVATGEDVTEKYR